MSTARSLHAFEMNEKFSLSFNITVRCDGIMKAMTREVGGEGERGTRRWRVSGESRRDKMMRVRVATEEEAEESEEEEGEEKQELMK